MNLTLAEFERMLRVFEAEVNEPGDQHVAMMNGLLIKFIAPRLSHYFSHVVAQAKMTDTVCNALINLFISPSGSLLPSELSMRLGMTRTSATRLADELEQKGWLEREPNQADRRSVVLRLTEAGRQTVREFAPKLTEARTELWRDFSPEEMQLLQTLLQKLYRRLNETGAPCPMCSPELEK